MLLVKLQLKDIQKNADIISGFANPIKGSTFYARFGNIPIVLLLFLNLIIFAKTNIGMNK